MTELAHYDLEDLDQAIKAAGKLSPKDDPVNIKGERVNIGVLYEAAKAYQARAEPNDRTQLLVDALHEIAGSSPKDSYHEKIALETLKSYEEQK